MSKSFVKQFKFYSVLFYFQLAQSRKKATNVSLDQQIFMSNFIKKFSLLTFFYSGNPKMSTFTGLRSAVGNISGNRCESDCRSRGREFDPSPVPFFRGT